MRAMASCAAVSMATGLWACGGSPGPNEKRFSKDADRRVAAVVDQLQQHARSDESKEICEDLLTPEFRRFIEKSYKTSCATRVKEQLVAPSATFRLEKLQVTGPLASATVKEQNGALTGIAFVKRDDEWRISRIQG